MKIIGVDPSYNGLGITVIDLIEKTIELHMIRRKNLGKKYWEVFTHAESIRNEYRNFFNKQGDYVVFFELPVMHSKFGVGLYMLNTLLLDFHNADEACLHVGLYNSNFLANFLRGRRSLKKSELKELGMNILERYRAKGYSITDMKWNADLSASLIFMSSGLVTLYKNVIERHIQLRFKLEGEQGISSVGVRWRTQRNSLTTGGTKTVGKESGEWCKIPVSPLDSKPGISMPIKGYVYRSNQETVSRNFVEGSYPSQEHHKEQGHVLYTTITDTNNNNLLLSSLFFLFNSPFKKSKETGVECKFSLSVNIFIKIINKYIERESKYISNNHSKINKVSEYKEIYTVIKHLNDSLKGTPVEKGEKGVDEGHSCFCYLIPVESDIGELYVCYKDFLLALSDTEWVRNMKDISGDLLKYGATDMDLRWKTPAGSLYDYGAIGEYKELL